MSSLALNASPSYIPSLIARLAWLYAEISCETSPPISTFRAPISNSVPDAWITDALSRIEGYRTYEAGWDGNNSPAPAAESLAAAEYLIAFFADWPISLRPQLALDMDGFPTFAAKSDAFYLHLTVEHQSTLTWYAVVGEREYFRDQVPFDGSELPAELASLVY